MEKFSYNDCKEYLSTFGLKSSYIFHKKVKEGIFDHRVPNRPYYFYSCKKNNDWISWEDFLGFSKENKRGKYLTFTEARDFSRSLKISNAKLWSSYHKKNQLYKMGIPSNPNVIYKSHGWISFADWLGLESYKNLKNLNYLPYEETKKFIKENFPEIKNKKSWEKFDKNKLPTNIPKRPDYIYKQSGDWINWETFLDSKISPRSKSKIILNFNEAKKFIQKFNLSDQYEYLNFLKSKNIYFLPKRPDHCYRDDWKGFLDFLGSIGNRTSIGEKLIKKYLDENAIKYEREKKFENCKNINHLPFDFYLPDFKICIEYDGEIHFKSNEYYGGDESLAKVQHNDRIKSEWCFINNIQLIRIPFNKKNKISDILSDYLNSMIRV